MKTPIFDFVKAYSESGFSRLHMPGHKGKSFLGCEALDITEIKGADELFHSEGIIAESESNAAALFSAGRTLYSTEGSSHGIRSMVCLALRMRENTASRPVILAGRNAHKSFLYALALTGCGVEWLYPRERSLNSLCACATEPEDVRRAWEEAEEKPFALYITSPDYLGQRADIGALARVCREKHMLLLVDNAHGAYFHFLPQPCHPMDLGADMCCDSAHKTLPVLTGGAYLHLSRAVSERAGELAKSTMALFASSSPSYLIMQSLDLCNKYLAGCYREALAETVKKIEAFKASLKNEGVSVLSSEPLKIVIDACAMGYTGTELQQRLREFSCEAEFADSTFLVCMLTPENPPQDYERLFQALTTAEKRAAIVLPELYPAMLSQGMGIREAMLSPAETIAAKDASGRICSTPTVSCPPAIPVAISGEIIDDSAVRLFRACGIDKIEVVKE